MIAESKDLTSSDYELFRRLVYAKSGINLGSEKIQLVRARLGKRVRQENFKSFREYYNYVEQDPTGEELCRLLDAISTNTTHLFREKRHFELLRDIITRWAAEPDWRAKNSTLRIWSAGCSSGEEPHSIAMVAHDALRRYQNVDLKILATDLSVRMLSRASRGLYEVQRVGTVPSAFQRRYLRKVEHDGRAMLQIVPELRRLIKFARLNLMAPTFPFRHGFQVI
ncbi:MAG: CheR family methyltransferase, partial [Dehalococcoidia bacterium]